ncbi:MAG TPA: hypothetical protein VE053_00540 [Allosphingosinicella sp.]|nr:hypothetical protein [Allosphingosinicella sp.]
MSRNEEQRGQNGRGPDRFEDATADVTDYVPSGIESGIQTNLRHPVKGRIPDLRAEGFPLPLAPNAQATPWPVPAHDSRTERPSVNPSRHTNALP